MSRKLDKFLMGISALFYVWKLPDLLGTILAPGTPIHKEFLVFVEKGKSLYCPNGFHLHTSEHRAARHWVSGTVCRPELCFVQACRRLNKWQAVLLGNQLCSRYPGRPTPLCTIESLQRCVDQLDRYPGVVMARWALPYIRRNAASPMESKQGLFWTLPVCHGGFGFRKMQMNQPARGASGQIYYLDCSVPGKKLDLEFNGKAYHSRPRDIAKDAARKMDLEAAGYTVITCEYEDLIDFKRLKKLVTRVGKIVGRKIRIRARKFFLAFWMIQDLIAQKYLPPRDQYYLIEEDQYPDFPGADTMYDLYREKRKERLDQLRVDFPLDWRNLPTTSAP